MRPFWGTEERACAKSLSRDTVDALEVQKESSACVHISGVEGRS